MSSSSSNILKKLLQPSLPLLTRNLKKIKNKSMKCKNTENISCSCENHKMKYNDTSRYLFHSCWIVIFRLGRNCAFRITTSYFKAMKHITTYFLAQLSPLWAAGAEFNLRGSRQTSLLGSRFFAGSVAWHPKKRLRRRLIDILALLV